MLKDNQRLLSYVDKGQSEIHWEGIEKKLKHFDLVTKLMKDYTPKIKDIISRTTKRCNYNEIADIIRNIDNQLPSELLEFKLSDDRKELMIKIITLRLQKLEQLQ